MRPFGIVDRLNNNLERLAKREDFVRLRNGFEKWKPFRKECIPRSVPKYLVDLLVTIYVLDLNI